MPQRSTPAAPPSAVSSGGGIGCGMVAQACGQSKHGAKYVILRNACYELIWACAVRLRAKETMASEKM
jgi:hypothetical protein